jgi:hypothetical protein
MNAFIITKRDSEFIDSPVFQAGTDDGEEAIAIFSSADTADQYILDAGWQDAQQVGTLKPVQVLRWLVLAHDQGIRMVVIDPNRERQLSGKPQAVIYLDDPMEAFAELLRGVIEHQAALPTGAE